MTYRVREMPKPLAASGWRRGEMCSVCSIKEACNRSVKLRIHQRVAVQAMCGQPMRSLALRTAIRPITTRVGNLFVVLLDGPSEGV